MPNYARHEFSPVDARPAKGTDLIDRRKKRNTIRNDEKKEKALVRARDKQCRWPHCENCRNYKPRLEVAHMEPKGSGGDHGVRTRADLMILIDFLTHQGSDGLERGERFIEPLTDAGTNGACAFYVKVYSETKPGEWTWHCVGVERSVGVIDSTITERVIGEPYMPENDVDVTEAVTQQVAEEKPVADTPDPPPAQPQGDGAAE